MTSKEELIDRLLHTYPALAFIELFVFEHPTAGLYLVGGALRDALLGRTARDMDFDFVITHLKIEDLEQWFRAQGEVNFVGQQFGVYKFMPRGFSARDIEYIDIALPRTEQATEKNSGGYKDFDVQSDPELPIEQDLSRRDFTINAMAFDARLKKLIDPFGGQRDIEQKWIRSVGNPIERLNEDLSRVLRAIRFSSELNFTIENKTSDAVRACMPKLNLQKKVGGAWEYVVPRETIGSELAKAFVCDPARVIRDLERYGGIEVLFPDLDVVIKHDARYLAPIERTGHGELTVVFTLLLRDFSLESVRHVFRQTGLETLARETPQRIERDLVVALVELLQRGFEPHQIASARAHEFEKNFFGAKGRLFLRCLELLDQQDLKQAIENRRRDIYDRWLVDDEEPIAPLLSGQDVLAQGVAEGPHVRGWLECVRDLQLDGKLMRREDAISWLKNQIMKTSSD